MSALNEGQHGSSPVALFRPDPADFFVEIYDALPESVFRGEEIEEWSGNYEFMDQADRITDLALAEGRLRFADVSDLLVNYSERDLLAIAVGLDEALTFADPFSAHVEQLAMISIMERYIRTGRLNCETSGALLPRRTYPGRPRTGKEKNHWFRIVRVPGRLRTDAYLNSTVASCSDPWYEPDSTVTVGFVPLVSSHAEIDITYSRSALGEALYELEAAPRLRDRLSGVLSALDQSGVDIGVLPEATLSDAIYKEWRDLIRRMPPPMGSKSRLRWLLLGTGPVDGRGNRAVLVDRWSGVEVLRQDKLADYTLTDWQYMSWRLPNRPAAFAQDTTFKERIPRDVTVRTLDTFLGRIGVLICEALARWADARHDEVIYPGTSHVFAPILSKPIYPKGWEDQAGTNLTSLVGSWVMVANSLSVHNALKRHRRTDIVERGYTCLVTGPLDVERKSYRLYQQYGSSSSAEEVAKVDVEASDEWTAAIARSEGTLRPWVRASMVSLDWFPELPPRPSRGSS